MARKKVGIADVAKRFGITAREARDIATAVGTAAQGLNKLGLKPSEKDALREKLIKQVSARMGGERGRTALRGKAAVSKAAKARISKAKNI